MNAKSFLQISAAVGLLAVGGCLCALILSVRADVVTAPAMATTAQNALLARVDRLQAAVDALPGRVVPSVVTAAQSEIRHGVDALDKRVGEALISANARLSDAIGAANTRLGELTETAAAVQAGLNPTLENVTKASAELPPAIRDLRVALARAGRTMGNVDGVTAKVNAAVPQFISIAAATGLKIQTTADESALTAQQTRLFMGNLAEATRPLPRWARIGLAVAPPLVQTGFTVGSWLALKGK